MYARVSVVVYRSLSHDGRNFAVENESSFYSNWINSRYFVYELDLNVPALIQTIGHRNVKDIS
jgi:hypothetical protein